MKKLILFLFFLLPLCFSSKLFADGKQDFYLVNDTGFEIYGIYVSPAGQESWSDNVFDEGYIDDGEEWEVNFNSDEEVCKWDIMVEDVEGNYYTVHNINLCKYHRVDLHFDGYKTTATYE